MATGVTFNSPEPPISGKAGVYFYRTLAEDWFSRRKIFDVEVDGKEVGSLAPGGFIRRDLDPGPHNIFADTVIGPVGYVLQKLAKKPGELTVNLAPGTINYVKLKVYQTSFSFGGDLTSVPESEALSELRTTNLSE